MKNTLEAASTGAPVNRTFQDYVNFLIEGITRKQSQIETFKHNTPHQASQLTRSNRGRGHRQGFYGHGGHNKSNSDRRRGCTGPTIQSEGKTLHVKTNYSREEYSKLSKNQWNVIRRARLKFKKTSNKSDNTSVISEVTSAVRSTIADTLQQATIQGNIKYRSRKFFG